jgi:hypothetical protein
MPLDPRRIEVMDDRMAEILRRKTPEEKMAMANAMWRSARTMLVFSLRQARPDWTAEQINREIARRMLHGAA